MSSDREFLGLSDDGGPGRFRFTVQDHLARLDGHLYGGTAIAVSLAAAEILSGRAGVWMTTQFVATAPPGTVVSVAAEVLAAGRRTSQVRVTGTDASGDTMFASLGATGTGRPGGLDGEFETMPTVTPPSESVPWRGPAHAIVERLGLDIELPPMPEDVGFARVIEFREPQIESHPDPGGGRVCLWVRRRDGAAVSAAMAAYMADMVPLAIAEAADALAGGISLDNSIRIGRFASTEWVLLDLRAHLVAGDYGHGLAHIWSEGGHLLATASQSCAMFSFDAALRKAGSGSEPTDAGAGSGQAS